MSADICLILARARNGVIGRDNAMPWHIPADLRRFKALTMGPDGAGRPMIMGRKTFESLPGLLPRRRHIVLTRDPDWRADGAETVRSVDEALALAGDGPVAVIGGAQVYGLFMPIAHRIEMTEVHADYSGDTYIPAPGPEWREVRREHHAGDGARPAYAFVTLVRDL